jgi:hypothetical protein
MKLGHLGRLQVEGPCRPRRPKYSRGFSGRDSRCPVTRADPMIAGAIGERNLHSARPDNRPIQDVPPIQTRCFPVGRVLGTRGSSPVGSVSRSAPVISTQSCLSLNGPPRHGCVAPSFPAAPRLTAREFPEAPSRERKMEPWHVEQRTIRRSCVSAVRMVAECLACDPASTEAVCE